MATPEWVPVVIDRPEATMNFRVEAYEDAGRIVVGIYDIKGIIKTGPHAFARALREEVARLEASVKELGAQELRVGGRWGRRILKGFEPFPIESDPLLRRKILNATDND
jgi:hypothetical protein